MLLRVRIQRRQLPFARDTVTLRLHAHLPKPYAMKSIEKEKQIAGQCDVK